MGAAAGSGQVPAHAVGARAESAAAGLVSASAGGASAACQPYAEALPMDPETSVWLPSVVGAGVCAWRAVPTLRVANGCLIGSGS